MGGKLGAKVRARSEDITAFVEGIPPEYKDNFDTLRGLIETMAPQTTQTLKWGTLAFDLDGSLFALSLSKKHMNFYILTTGVIAKHKAELAGIPQSACCLRFGPGAKLPMPALRKVMKAAIAVKTR